MKTKEELIKEIDRELANKHPSNILNDPQTAYAANYAKFEMIDSELSPKQNYVLHMAIKEVEDGNIYSWDDYLSLMKEWKSK